MQAAVTSGLGSLFLRQSQRVEHILKCDLEFTYIWVKLSYLTNNTFSFNLAVMSALLAGAAAAA